MFNQTEMNMNYTKKTRFVHTEMNYIETNNYVLYENPEPLMSSLEFHPAHLISLLLVSCLGLVTNTISAMVWFAKVKSKTVAFFLVCLSGVDAFFCLSMAVLKYMELPVNYTCKYCIVHTIALSLAITSRLLALPVVAHRWVAVSRPLAMTRVFTLRRQIKVQACLVFSLLPIYGVLIYSNILQCRYSDIDPNWLYVWDKYYRVILFSWNALITICLLVLNTLLLTAVCRMKKIVPSHVIGNWQNRVEQHITVIVLFMSVFSMSDNMMYFVDFLQTMDIAQIHSITTIGILVIIFQWALVLNNSINFVLYMCFAKDFRLTLLSMYKSVAIRITRYRTHRQMTKLRKETNSNSIDIPTNG